MMARVALLLWLLLVWVALWGELSPANVLSGLLLAGILMLSFPLGQHVPIHRVRPLPLLRFTGYFVYKLVEANLVVAREVVTPSSSIQEGIVAVPVRSSDDMLLTMLGNAISLTPGTLTIEVRRAPPTLYVHVLHMRDIDQTRRDLQRLELLMLAALAPEVLRRAASDPAGEPGGKT